MESILNFIFDLISGKRELTSNPGIWLFIFALVVSTLVIVWPKLRMIRESWHRENKSARIGLWKDMLNELTDGDPLKAALHGEIYAEIIERIAKFRPAAKDAFGLALLVDHKGVEWLDIKLAYSAGLLKDSTDGWKVQIGSLELISCFAMTLLGLFLLIVGLIFTFAIIFFGESNFIANVKYIFASFSITFGGILLTPTTGPIFAAKRIAAKLELNN